MSLSAFGFLRGAAAVMAADLATTPVTGPRVQLCGDAHVSNFGVFATPERDEVFDVNDFDETLPGPWEWDVKRLATSLVLAGRLNDLSRSENRRAVRRAVGTYRESMLRYAGMSYLDTWYAHLDRASIAELVQREGRRALSGAFRAARRRTSLQAFPRIVQVRGGRYRIRDEPPLIVHYTERADAETSQRFYERYVATLPPERRLLFERYRVVDVAQKVVGVGSVGTECSVMLLLGDGDAADPLFLQAKQALPSVLEACLGASEFANHAERVVTGQRLMQQASDVFLGSTTYGSKDFYIRQWRDMKFSPEVRGIGRRGLVGRAELCMAGLARAHARTGDAATIGGYLGEETAFDRAVADFAEAYADQTEADYAALLLAIKKGRIAAVRAS
jgi:uncharacterized protein (DUF2252 family)